MHPYNKGDYTSYNAYYNINHNLIDLENKIKNECEKKLNSLKINKSDKIVCLHVRDGGYRKDNNRRSYRNIKKFL